MFQKYKNSRIYVLICDTCPAHTISQLQAPTQQFTMDPSSKNSVVLLTTVSSLQKFVRSNTTNTQVVKDPMFKLEYKVKQYLLF
jgi:hypothetical protein